MHCTALIVHYTVLNYSGVYCSTQHELHHMTALTKNIGAAPPLFISCDP